MSYESDLPPNRSAEPPPDGHAPPDDPRPNAALLKADIDSGRSGDKNTVLDPGLSMLGTDEEAGGTPLTHDQIRTARLDETSRRWRFGSPSASSAAHAKNDGRTLGGFIGLIAAIGIVLVAAVVWLG